MNKISIVLDTNIFMSAFCFDGQVRKLFKLILNKINSNELEVFISDDLFNEISDKFLNGRVKKILKEKYDHDSTISFVETIKKLSTLNFPTTKINLCRDPEDDMLLELAYGTNADYIISGDKDLLVLNGESFEDYTFNVIDVSGFLNLI